MTSRVDPATAAQAVENTLQLGEVTFQGRTYIAILHYFGEDGEKLEITNPMKAAQTAYCQAVQEILAQAGNEAENSNSLLNRVSTGGFVFTAEGDETSSIPTHRQLKTEEAWNRFLYSLYSPQLGLVGGSHVELHDITDLTRRRDALYRTINQKLENADETNPPNFDEDEKHLLHLSGFTKLSNGQNDIVEISRFHSLYIPGDDDPLVSDSE